MVLLQSWSLKYGIFKRCSEAGERLPDDGFPRPEQPGAAQAGNAGSRTIRYCPNELCPDLSAKRIRGAHDTPKTIGVLALDTVTTPFSVEITLSIEETARAHGWNSFVVNMFSDDSPEAIVDLLLSHRPGGIIYTTMGLRQVPVPAKLLTLPCVLANCESLNGPVASFIPDDEQGQYEAVKGLLAAGYTRPLCLHLPENHLATVRRRQGWSAPATKRVLTLIR